MDVLDPLLADDAEAWVSALPQYQQDIVLSFLDQDGDPAVAATQWLTASGPSHTFPFGGKKPEAIFYEKLLAEVEAFLCGDDRYEKERGAFLAEFDSRQAYVVGSVSAIVAPAVGSAAAIIAPAIALHLRNSWKDGSPGMVWYESGVTRRSGNGRSEQRMTLLFPLGPSGRVGDPRDLPAETLPDQFVRLR